MPPVPVAPLPPQPGAAPTLPAALRPGALLHALVLGAAGGEAQLQVAGARLAVRTELPLAAGERVALRVLEAGRQPVLAVEPRPAATVAGAAAPVEVPVPEPVVPAHVQAIQAARALPAGQAGVLGERLALLAAVDPAGLAAAVPKLAAEVLGAMPEARALAALAELLPTVPPGAAEAGATPLPTHQHPQRRLARLLQRAGQAEASPAAREALRQELAALPPAERAALAGATAARERAVLDASPELAWLRSVQTALAALAEARPAPPEAGASSSGGPWDGPSAGGVALLLPSLPVAAPPDRLRLAGEPPEGEAPAGAPERPAHAVLELGLPGLGPTVASLRLLGAALEVRVELADGDRVATVAGRLPELAAALEALGLRAAASATPARAATLDGGDAPVRRPAATGFALWA